MSRPARWAALIAAVLLGGTITPGRSDASTAAAAGGTEGTSTATWSATATQSASDPPPPGPLTLTFTKSGPQYFVVDNTGTVNLTGLSYMVVVTGGTLTETLTLSACSVAWTGNRCSTGSQLAGQWTASTSGIVQSSALAPVAPLATIYLEASIGGKFAATTAVISVEVSSSNPRQIRSAITTNQ